MRLRRDSISCWEVNGAAQQIAIGPISTNQKTVSINEYFDAEKQNGMNLYVGPEGIELRERVNGSLSIVHRAKWDT